MDNVQELADSWPGKAARAVFDAFADGQDPQPIWRALVEFWGARDASKLLREHRPETGDIGALRAAEVIPGYRPSTITPQPPPLPRCEFLLCEGHLGKFSSCKEEALWSLSLDGMWADEQTGDVEFEGHFSLFILPEQVLVSLEPGQPVIAARIINIEAGNYIVQTTNQGFVYLMEYDTETEARAAFKGFDDAHAEWATEEEDQ